MIPVIDLKGGLVVRANRGDRANYTAIDTPLAPGTSEPAAIARALLNFCPKFDCLYVADIDAITRAKCDPRRTMAAALAVALPGTQILLDDGANHPADVEHIARTPSIIPVIGSETLKSIEHLEAMAEVLPSGFVLSLDWRADNQQLGPSELFEAPQLWPHTVIVMTLNRVGAKTGPDFSRLARIKAMAGGREVLAAGGIRDISDLRALSASDCGALVATALHDGSLSPNELASVA